MQHKVWSGLHKVHKPGFPVCVYKRMLYSHYARCAGGYAWTDRALGTLTVVAEDPDAVFKLADAHVMKVWGKVKRIKNRDERQAKATQLSRAFCIANAPGTSPSEATLAYLAQHFSGMQVRTYTNNGDEHLCIAGRSPASSSGPVQQAL